MVSVLYGQEIDSERLRRIILPRTTRTSRTFCTYHIVVRIVSSSTYINFYFCCFAWLEGNSYPVRVGSCGSW